MIALFSSKLFGASHTGGVLVAILTFLHVKMSVAGLAMLHHLIRKSAHFTAYGILSALFFRAVRGPLPEVMWKISWPLIALGVCLVTSSSDEIHQFFTPGREGTYRDVMLDMSGALFAQLVILVVYLGKAGRRPKTLSNGVIGTSGH